ncbi:MAG: type II secretion system protein, partial [Candidatus Paceibacterota bacterium]
MYSRQLGFTLIELLVVVAIIGVLASVVLASLNNARAISRDTARLVEIRQIQTALELYHNDHGEYPDEQLYVNSPSVFVGDCGGSNNWELFIKDVIDPYVSATAHDPLYPSNPWPYCYMYKKGDYSHCPPSGQDYTLLFVSEQKVFDSLKLYGIQGEG